MSNGGNQGPAAHTVSGGAREAGVWSVLGAGAGGGLAYLAYLIRNGGLPAGGDLGVDLDPHTQLALNVVAVLILSAFAAGGMVYLIVPVDRRKLGRALIFAALCGFCWEPSVAGLTTFFGRNFTDQEALGLLQTPTKPPRRPSPLRKLPTRRQA